MSYLCSAILNKLFDMKWKELIKIAEAHGYKFESHGKSMTDMSIPKQEKPSWLSDTAHRKSARD